MENKFFCCIVSSDGNVREWLEPFTLNIEEGARKPFRSDGKFLAAVKRASEGVPCVLREEGAEEMELGSGELLVLPVSGEEGTALVVGRGDMGEAGSPPADRNTFNLLCSYFHSLNENLTLMMANLSEMLEAMEEQVPRKLVRNMEAAYRNTASLTGWIVWRLFRLTGGTGGKGHDVLLGLLPELRRLLGRKGMVSLMPYLKKCRFGADSGEVKAFLETLLGRIAPRLPEHTHVLMTADETRGEDGGEARARLGFSFRSYRHSLEDISFFTSPTGFIKKDEELKEMYARLREEGMSIRSRPGRQFAGFTLEFPVEEEEDYPAVSKRDTPVRTILVVEDVAEIRELLMEGLSSAGYNVLGAADAEHAIAMADGFPVEIDALITDVVLPGIDGSELADRLVRKHPRMRVLFTSGHLPTMLKMSGNAWFLQKPFEMPTMRKVLEELLEDVR